MNLLNPVHNYISVGENMKQQSRTITLLFLSACLQTAAPIHTIEPISMVGAWVGSQFFKLGIKTAKTQLEPVARDLFEKSVYQLERWDVRRKCYTDLIAMHKEFFTEYRHNRQKALVIFNKDIQIISGLDTAAQTSVTQFLKNQNAAFEKLIADFALEFTTIFSNLHTQQEHAVYSRYQQELALQKSQDAAYKELEAIHDRELKALSHLSTTEYNRITQEQREQRKCMRQDHEKIYIDLQHDNKFADSAASLLFETRKREVLDLQKIEFETFLKNQEQDRASFLKRLASNQKEKNIVFALAAGIIAVAWTCSEIYKKVAA